MKWHALKDKPGAYEIRRSEEEIFGGIIVDGKNRGIGFVGDAANNSYLFEYEDGMIHKTVRVFANSKNSPIGTVKLGFTDCGTLDSRCGTYAWNSLMSSKTWTDSAQTAVMFLDLEGDVARPISVLIAESLDPQARELLTLCGWYLTLIEYRTDFSNSKLAGMPVKTAEFQQTVRQAREANSGKYGTDPSDWWDTLIELVVD